MKRTLHALFLTMLAAVSTWAQPSATYYSSINGKQQATLKAELGIVISDHKQIKYNDLWAAYEKTDIIEGETNNSGQPRIFDYYSEDLFYANGTGNQISGMNREHVVPQSWWGSGTDVEVGSDLFQVLPSQASANSSKGNYPLGVVTTVTTATNCFKTGRNASGQLVFEPCDEYKGDFARIYFYVATCYPGAAWREPNGAECAFIRESYPTIKENYIRMLLRWNQEDPVSDWEKTRQERVFNLQQNRNPFIDYPDLANYIWGELSSQTFNLAAAELYHITPFDYSEDNSGATPIDVEIGEQLMAENFSSITAGNSYETSGSSSQWNGNGNFAQFSAVYQAGGSLRMGTGSNPGSLTTKTLTFPGGTLYVTAKVKGWSSVEGKLVISVAGTDLSQTINYGATMSDDFETVSATFTDVPANPQITFATTTKRCFLDDLAIYSVVEKEPETEINIDLASALATFCSTRNLDFTGVDGLKAYVATGYTHGKITLTRVTNVPANTGLVLVSEPGSYTIPIGDGEAVLTNLLVGTTRDLTMSPTTGSYTNLILSNGSDGIGFYPVTGGTLAAGKAYLPLPTLLVQQAAGVKSFGLQFEDNEDLPTDIAEQLNDSVRERGVAWFTLDGRRLPHQPRQSGIYLRSGRKVVVR